MPKLSLAFICKKCFNPKPADVLFAFNNNNDKEVHLNKIEINTWCEKCNKYSFHFMCDRDIAESIELLNLCGYKTKYSCQGHPEFNKRGELRGFDTYVFIEGNKSLGEGLFTKVREAGFNDWCICNNKGKLGKIVNLNDEKELRELLDSSLFSFHYSIHKVIKRAKQIDKEPITKDEKLIKMDTYYKNINTKLVRKIKEYIREEYV